MGGCFGIVVRSERQFDFERAGRDGLEVDC